MRKYKQFKISQIIINFFLSRSVTLTPIPSYVHGTITSGMCDLAFYRTFYPARSENLTDGVHVDDAAIDIIGVLEEEEKHEFARPDLLIYSMNVYWTIIAFIILWSILNVQATLIRTPVRRLTLVGLVKKILANALDLVTDHASPIPSLQAKYFNWLSSSRESSNFSAIVCCQSQIQMIGLRKQVQQQRKGQ